MNGQFSICGSKQSEDFVKIYILMETHSFAPNNVCAQNNKKLCDLTKITKCI